MFSISDDGIKTRARKYLKPPRLVGDPGSRLSSSQTTKKQKTKIHRPRKRARGDARRALTCVESRFSVGEYPRRFATSAIARLFASRRSLWTPCVLLSFLLFCPLLFLPFGSSSSSSGFVFSSCLKVSLKISPKSKRNFFLFSPPPRNRPRSRARFSDPRPRVPVLAFRGARVPSPNASFPERVRRREKRTSVAPLLVKGFPSFSLVLKRDDESLDEEETDECPKAGFGLRA